MNESSSDSGKRGHACAWRALSLIKFGVLMAFRAELHSIWSRPLVASIAFALLYVGIQGFRHKP